MATTLRDYLTRFRRLAAPPGGAAPAGVPVDRVVELSAELAAVFAAIDEIQASVERLEHEAEEQADRSLRDARTAADRIAADARERAGVARAEAAATRRQAREDEIRSILAHGEAEAEQIRRRGDDRTPALVREVVAIVRSEGSRSGDGRSG